ncbi:hypothetical protein FQA39_LY01683 [Lamprigera yunnana]|nr:hypothetical protein FQA39_LY01683 [Lamprigera yunnana]
MVMALLTLIVILMCFSINISENKTVGSGIRSDFIVTEFNVKTVNKVEVTVQPEINDTGPGWMKRQLLRVGGLFGSIGNKLGGFTSRVTNALDKLCDVIKTIIPVVAAVCHVGHFQFCGSVMDAPNELAEALAPNTINLSVQD